MDVCARCAGGNNAGHTIVVSVGPEKAITTYAFHLLPSGICHIFSWPCPISDTISIGIINPKCVGLIGSGVVVHVPSLFAELDALQAQGTYFWRFWSKSLTSDTGLDCTNRLFISDRAHLVFDFHQIVDGLKEVELGGSRYLCLFFYLQLFLTLSSIGTTKKGIGPAYSGKASRSGLRIHHLFDHEQFAEKFRKVIEGRFKRYGSFEYDTEGEIQRYKVNSRE